MTLHSFKTKLNELIFSKKVFPFALFYLVCGYVVSFVFVGSFYLLKIFLPFLTHTEGPFKKPTSLTEKIIIGLIVAPLFETYIFQDGVFKILKGKMRDSFIIFISALLFGLSHFYDLFYTMNTFLIGLVFAVAYRNWEGNNINKFWMIVIIHAMYNLVALLASL